MLYTVVFTRFLVVNALLASSILRVRIFFKVNQSQKRCFFLKNKSTHLELDCVLMLRAFEKCREWNAFLTILLAQSLSEDDTLAVSYWIIQAQIYRRNRFSELHCFNKEPSRFFSSLSLICLHSHRAHHSTLNSSWRR